MTRNDTHSHAQPNADLTGEVVAGGGQGASRSYAEALNDRWTLHRQGSAAEQVTLPHDAMLAEPRSARAASGSHGGYFPGGRYRYTRQWTTPADLGQRHVTLVFEGVQGSCEVFIDDTSVGTNTNGYDEFAVELPTLEAATTHEIRVEVDNTTLPTSRWYTGSGIYRPVSVRVDDLVHLTRDGVRTTTTTTDTGAVLAIDLIFANPAVADVTAEVTLSRHGETVAQTTHRQLAAACRRRSSSTTPPSGPRTPPTCTNSA